MTTESVSPRILVERDHYHVNTGEYRSTTYQAIQPNGTTNKEFCDTEIIGYAEFPPHSRVRSCDTRAAFEDQIDDAAEYVHWKDGGNQ